MGFYWCRWWYMPDCNFMNKIYWIWIWIWNITALKELKHWGLNKWWAVRRRHLEILPWMKMIFCFFIYFSSVFGWPKISIGWGNDSDSNTPPSEQPWFLDSKRSEFDRSHAAGTSFPSSPSHWQQVEEQAPKPVGWMMCFLLRTFVPVQKLCVNIYIYIHALLYEFFFLWFTNCVLLSDDK